ncbi:sodium-coupled monocarboxylate transporter 1-like [Chironomus tepperi]|uniref:sodium-coupled monocarboxylate transporter 1-like n=1 Tax=Chironomus tepperi TaxID=113505 RepID=UPI00391F7E38
MTTEGSTYGFSTEDSFFESSSAIPVTMESLKDVTEHMQTFGFIDYTIFLAMLLCCICIGLHFGREDQLKRKKLVRQDSAAQAADYLMGGRDMPVIPIALSLTASLVSGNMLLGTATEMYLYGMQYFYAVIGVALCGVAMHYIIIPVFHDLQITSTYEYLERRFDKKLRMFGSLMFMIGVNLFLPIVIYVPALAFNQTTNINIHVITPVVMVICIFYTCVGGMKGVVWTDVVQVIILYVTLFVIAIKGTMNIGGIGVLIERNRESGRIQGPDLRLDPTIRHSFWTVVIGYAVLQIAANGLNQNMIQRFMALKTVRKARISNVINIIGIIVMLSVSCYNGLLVYATYFECDPLTTGLAKAKDQLLPLMVMENFNDIPGLAGFFVAGVFAAALSTLSTAYNSMAAVVFEDFFKAHSKEEISETKTFIIMRGTVLALGTLSVLLVYIVQHMGPLLQLTFTIPATSLGPMLGVFTIGLMIPWIGKRATFYSVIAVYVTFLVYVLKTQMHVASGTIRYDERPTSTGGCSYNFTSSDFTTTTLSPDIEPVEPKRSISYLYFTLLGGILVVLLAAILSIFFGFEDPRKVDPQTLAPFMRGFFKQEFNPVDLDDRDERKGKKHTTFELDYLDFSDKKSNNTG